MKRGFISPILLLLIGLMLGVSSVYLIVKQKSTTDQSSNDTQQTSSATDNIDNWKTEKNSQYKFSFKYPQDWKTISPQWIGGFSGLKLVGLMPENKVTELYPPPISIEYYDNPDNLSLEKWQEKKNDHLIGKPFNFYSPNTKIIAINGNNVYFNEDLNCEPLGCDQAIIVGNGGVYAFYNLDMHGGLPSSQYSKQEIANNKKIFNQILSTFTFN